MKIVVFLMFSVVFSAFSQQKFEREYRIDLEEVPPKASSFIAKCGFDRKVKWYTEESQDGKTIEAKSCKKGYKYSIEFSRSGTVLDVEKTIKWKEIAAIKQKAIQKSLKNRFEKYRLKKIQIQWQTDHEFYIDLINGKGENEINEFYEIVVKGSKNKTSHLYEVLIDASGTILKELQFAPQNTDNLEF